MSALLGILYPSSPTHEDDGTVSSLRTDRSRPITYHPMYTLVVAIPTTTTTTTIIIITITCSR